MSFSATVDEQVGVEVLLLFKVFKDFHFGS